MKVKWSRIFFRILVNYQISEIKFESSNIIAQNFCTITDIMRISNDYYNVAWTYYSTKLIIVYYCKKNIYVCVIITGNGCKLHKARGLWPTRAATEESDPSIVRHHWMHLNTFLFTTTWIPLHYAVSIVHEALFYFFFRARRTAMHINALLFECTTRSKQDLHTIFLSDN